ncbi:hypothetical protein B0H17DRAFT_1137540 [Mycena rosella]|uniref:Uncharacterized protein n=1 Tax=Mycena rosella TaxID=1033263 RepID=A0AAD7D884_MYCRO|nr:hypothetical protein B0H17DRAFT_1137540 [Mycena rosella]
MGKRKVKKTPPHKEGRINNESKHSRAAKQSKIGNHRRASAAYKNRYGGTYHGSCGDSSRLTSHPEEVKARKQDYIAACRLAEKLKRRQWDPPKPKPPRLSEADDARAHAGELDPDQLVTPHLVDHVEESLRVALAPSVNSDEQLAAVALAGKAGADPALEMARLLNIRGSSSSLPKAGAVLLMERLIRVRDAQAAVAALSMQPFARISLIDAMMWSKILPLKTLPYLLMSVAAYQRVNKWRWRLARTADNEWDCEVATVMAELAKT